MSITHRLGCFFLFIGGLIFLLFLATDMARAPEFSTLWISLPLLGFGFYLWRRGRPKPRPSGRFRMIHRMRREKKNPQASPPEENKHGS
jgi:hypothetical protein